MSEPRTSLETGVSRLARDLIWETFFAGANRGVDFKAHIPWYADNSTRSVLLQDESGKVLATAIIRPARQAGVAMVGFVCVDEAVRGRGLGRQLVAAVNNATDAAGYRASLLWTGSPGIYDRNGYVTVGRDDFVRISKRRAEIVALATTKSVWPDSDSEIGLPAFARSAHRIRSDRAEVVVADGGRGTTLIDWRGTPTDVLAIMDATSRAAWNVNLPRGSAFLKAVPTDRYAIGIAEGAVTMVRWAGAEFALDDVSVADRI